MADGVETQLLVRFVTKLPAELRVPEAEVAVPVNLRRYGLSQIINHLLALDPARPFDFIINGEMVRKSLQQHLLAHNISTEEVVELEYVPAVVPPEEKQALPHDDWVSCLSACSSSYLVSGSYDGAVRLWDEQGDCVGSFAAHGGGVNDVAAVPQQRGGEAGMLLVTAGKDHTLRLWRLHPAPAAKGPAAEPLAVLGGHLDSVECVTVAPAGDRCCSGGWDGRLLLWRSGAELAAAAAEAAEAAPAQEPAAKKKRKAGAVGAAAAAQPLGEAPVGGLEAHSQCVAAVAWPEQDVVVSGGWDHSVRRFDVPSGVNTDTYNGSKAVLAVAAAAGSGGRLVAFGGSEAAVRVWDVRVPGGQQGLGVRGLGGHSGWVAAVAWDPASDHHFASASYDGSVKLWDLRAEVALATLAAHDDKALAVGWWGGRLASGGADGQLRLYVPGAGGSV